MKHILGENHAKLKNLQSNMNLIAATLQKCGVLSVLERQIESVQEGGRVQAQTYLSPPLPPYAGWSDTCVFVLLLLIQ